MDPEQAARNLEVIRTLMERTCQYQLLTARAALAAGSLALLGAAAFLLLEPADPAAFGAVWGLVLAGSLLATAVGTLTRGRARGEKVWSRQTRAVLLALLPGLVAAAALTAFFFARQMHLWLPGAWMLCYGQGALATSAFAPAPIRWLGLAMLLLGAASFALGPAAAVPLMAAAFGGGHLAVGAALLAAERRRARPRLFRGTA
jgi:hypothetical protein